MYFKTLLPPSTLVFKIVYFLFQIRNVAANMCIDTRFKNQNERFTIEPCIKDGGETGGEQVCHSYTCLFLFNSYLVINWL